MAPGNWPVDSNFCQSVKESSEVPNDGIVCMKGRRRKGGGEGGERERERWEERGEGRG